MQYRANDISTFIEDQFPGFYKEDSQQFIEFVKEYYSFLDTQNDRNFSKIRDIDSTLEGFLVYYKRKYLADLPFVNFQDTDIPFLVKHARDFYSRKGTQEALQLLFRMFYRQEVEVYQPASQILKLSDSKYTFNVFIEFIPVSKISEFPIQKGDTIEGDTSKATAFVDEVVFYNINGALTPVAYISNVYGSFITDDGLKVSRNGSVFYPGKLIYGSITDTEILAAGNRAGNVVGDRVNLVSSNFGVDAEAIITKVSETPSGVVDWQLLDGGWGYSTTSSQNIIYKSTQVLVVSGDEIPNIQPFDTVSAVNREITDRSPANPVSVADRGSSLTYYGSGTVIAYEHPVLFIQTEPRDFVPQDGAFVAVRIGVGTEADPATSSIIDFPTAGLSTVLLTRANGDVVTVPIDTQAEYNNTASFDIQGYNNLETVSLITDLVGDFVNVPLTAGIETPGGFGMSGPTSENRNTAIKDAFEVQTFELGSIANIRVTDSGTNYKNNVRTIVRMPEIYRFDYGLMGLLFDRTDFLITTDDILEQTIQVQDLTYDLVTNPTGYVDYTVRGRFVRREGNLFFFKPLTFYQFKLGGGITFRGRTLNVLSKVERPEQLSGGNANITGTAEFLVGQIKEIDILKSGFRYRTGETVALVNQETNEAVANAKLEVSGMGQTEGYWATTTSHLNDNNRFIHDNDFYQEYSYQISSILDPSVYEDVVKQTTHVAGAKMFSSPLINTLNDVRPTADVAIEAYDLTPVPLTTEDGTLMFTEGSLNLQAVMYAIIQESVGLGAAQTGGTEFPILSSIIMRDRGDGQAFANIKGGGQSVAGLTQPLPVGVYCTASDAAELLGYINNPAGYSGSYRTEIENLIDAINNEKANYDPPLENEDVVVTLGQPTRTVNYSVWNETVSEQFVTTLVNFGGADIEFDNGMDSNLGLVGDFDFSLDTFDETRLTLDNATLTFDRT